VSCGRGIELAKELLRKAGKIVPKKKDGNSGSTSWTVPKSGRSFRSSPAITILSSILSRWIVSPRKRNRPACMNFPQDQWCTTRTTFSRGRRRSRFEVGCKFNARRLPPTGQMRVDPPTWVSGATEQLWNAFHNCSAGTRTPTTMLRRIQEALSQDKEILASCNSNTI
jgi:hypothetical protein